MSSRPDPRLLATIDGFTAGRGRIQDKVFAALYGVWGGFDGWHKPSLVEDVAEESSAAVAAGQAGVAALTDAYLAKSTSLVRDRPVSGVGVGPEMRQSLRSGVTGPEVQARVAQEFRWQFYRGLDVADAFDVAMNRAQESASQDLNLAFQRQTAKFTTRREVKQFRRVTRGEGTCGLCVAASNQVYTRGDLLPIHARCRCTVLEVGSVLGGGRVVSDEQYAAVASASRSLNARDLKDVRWAVDEHGELGPVLRNKNQRISQVNARGQVQKKGPKSPEMKKLPLSHGIDALRTPADVDRVVRISEGSLKYARANNLTSQIEWHEARLGLLRDRRARLTTAA